MTTVATRVYAPDAATKAGSTAALRLVASLNGEAAGLDPGTLSLLHGTREAPIPSHGWYIESLRPNSLIAPSENYYALVTQVKGRGSVVSNFEAPASPASGTLTAAATLSTSTTFTLALATASTVFASASASAPKLVVIDGIIVQYTGQTPTALTGCTTYSAGSSPYAIGTVVEQAYWIGDILIDPPVGLGTLHTLDPIAAHVASALSFTPAAGVAATDLQAAVVEVAGDITAEIARATAAEATKVDTATNQTVGGVKRHTDGIVTDAAAKFGGLPHADVTSPKYGDYVTNPKAAIEAAVADLPSEGGTVFVPVVLPPLGGAVTAFAKPIRLLGVSPYASKVQGTGFTLLKCTHEDGIVLEHLTVEDPTGHASTVLVDLDNGASGIGSFSLNDVILKGNPALAIGSRLGTGLRLDFALKGSVVGCQLLWLNTGAYLKDASNADLFVGTKVRGNVIGIDIDASGLAVDDVFLTGCTVEGNLTGIRSRAGKLTADQCHFENTTRDINILAGTLHTSKCGFFPGGTYAIETAGSGSHSSDHDTLNNGSSGAILHNGTGLYLVRQPNPTPTYGGTGAVFSDEGISWVGRNLSGNNLLMTGFLALALGMPLTSATSTDLRVTLQAAREMQFAKADGTRCATLDEATGKFFHNFDLYIGGALQHVGSTAGFNNATPVTKRTLGAAATDAATTQTLANNLRQALIDLGLGQT